jgi:flagellar M-ring protein FliF
VLGTGQAVVRVSADLNWDTITRTEVKFDPDGQVARTTMINDETTETSTGGGATVPPGAAANSADTNSAAPSPLNKSHMEKKVTNNEYEINKITSNIVQSAGGIKRLSTAVFIAQRFEGTGADRKAVPRSTQELKKIRDLVQSALGLEETGDPSRKDQITLEEMPFNDQPAVELSNQLVRQEKHQVWFDLVQKGLYPALATGVLFLFWRMLKKTAKDEIPIALPAASGNGHRKPSHGGVVTVEVLNQLIRENPANMTQAVRSWLSRGKPQE